MSEWGLDSLGQGDSEAFERRSERIAQEAEQQEDNASDSSDATEDAGPRPYPYPIDETRVNGTSSDLVQGGEYRFLPVIGYMAADATATRDEGEEPYRVNGRTLSWWEEQSITPQYPFVLVNPVGYSNLDGEDHMYADSFRFNKGEQFILCDSGGYQMSTRKEGEIVDDPSEHSLADVKLYPEKVVDWQVRNADAGLILDVPPNYVEPGTKLPNNKKFKPQNWIDDIFYPHLEQSLDHAERMRDRLEELRDMGIPGADDFYQLGVVHGRSTGVKEHEWSLLQDSYDRMEEAMDHPRAYALSPQPPHSLGQMALHMAFALDRFDSDHVEYVHVLQGGGNTQRALLEYFAMLSDFFVTSDASSHIRGTQWRQFYVPGTWNQDIITVTERHGERWRCEPCSEELEEDKTEDVLNPDSTPPECPECGKEMDFVSPYQQVDRFPCACAVCSHAEGEMDASDITANHDAYDGQVINMHNLHQSMNSARFVAATLRKYGEDVVDDLTINSDSMDVAEPHQESNNHSYNQFWHYMTRKFSRRNVIQLHRGMRFLRDVKQKGLEGAMADGWHIPGDSQKNRDELEYQPERDGLDW